MAVAVVHGAPAVQVRGDRHRSSVPAGRGGERRARVPARRPARRVRPVQRRVHRQQVGQVAPVPVDELVDPHDADGTAGPGLDGPGGRGEAPGMIRRTVPPQRGGRAAGRQHLLPELPDADDVAVAVALLRGGHGRRDDERRHVLRDSRRVERAGPARRPPGGRHPGRGGRLSRPAGGQQGGSARRRLQDLTSSDHLGSFPGAGKSGDRPALRHAHVTLHVRIYAL